MAVGTKAILFWRLGTLHVLVGAAILFATLHPLRDALDPHSLVLVQTGSGLEAINGLGLLWLTSRPQSAIASWLIGLGTLAFAAMLYFIAFTGQHPFDPAVPLGGISMAAGWAKLLFERP